MSEATQQHTLELVLSNEAPTGCDLAGYPRVTLLGQRGTVLPFIYRDRGDQMLSSAAPAVVGLAPGADTYVAINKNACVGYTSEMAARLFVTLPGEDQALTVAITAQDRHLDYCPTGDPGHTVDVTPVEPTLTATLWQDPTGH